jgi:hypothetical protein
VDHDEQDAEGGALWVTELPGGRCVIGTAPGAAEALEAIDRVRAEASRDRPCA